ncbi:MarR family transcriptional regulator [Nonomuraea fuscirosea]|jgi:DNA-binding MarR family transcriptional regulator|uniref:MarR family winged helix-turn-helix transcriptional regulator n=1 Tax=Nonomuraea fuscirosea TaxID=1291556 RepID=UPI002DD8F03E|nr:MarR family transcriptional regulator [Nonomuraea fuscirosea]WSA49268.1 MarR family transcriptional regulator [Nonomuraea fuscirosea]
MEDSVDRHLARWRGKAPFDERVEAIVTRLQSLVKHLGHTKEAALSEVGMQDFEFETLHRLVARGGSATPSELAADLLLSPAGMTGRLDTLERSQLVRRVRSTEDRRRVDVELTPKGHDLWTDAMTIRAEVEAAMISTLPPEDQTVLNNLLKRLLLNAETPR